MRRGRGEPERRAGAEPRQAPPARVQTVSLVLHVMERSIRNIQETRDMTGFILHDDHTGCPVKEGLTRGRDQLEMKPAGFPDAS